MVYVLLGTGFEEIEAIAPVDILRRGGVEVLTVGVSGRTVSGSHGIPVQADILPEEMDLTGMEMIVVPGGLGGVASIRGCKAAMDAIAFAHDNGKYTAAICAGPTVLADLGITRGKRAVCYPGCEDGMDGAVIECAASVTDGRLITGTSAGCAVSFGLALLRALKGERQAEAIERQIVIR